MRAVIRIWQGKAVGRTPDIATHAQGGLLPEGERVYAIGDIHGNRILLDLLLDRIARHVASAPKAHTTLVFLGDYVDRGPDSAGVIDTLIAPMPFVDRVVHLTGNHEDVMLEFLAKPDATDHWLRFGGLETMESYGVDIDPSYTGDGNAEIGHAFAQALPPGHLTFLRNLRSHVAIGGYFFVHAGVRPGVPLDRQAFNDLIWIREPFLDSNADFGARIVHGHTPVVAADVRRNRINVDTGAFATGCLTCVILEGRRVSLLDTVSPDERIVT